MADMVAKQIPMRESPSQTAGPYVQIGCTPNLCGLENMYGGKDLGNSMLNERTRGRRISISGQVLDGTGTPIRDGIVEIWQADHQGLYNSPLETRGKPDPDFWGWGRQATGFKTRRFRFETIIPGQVPWPDGRMQAPHINFWIGARGVNLGLNTRMYFPDFEEMNDHDPILSGLEHRSRISTLVAEALSADAYRFDIVLQGHNETLFFEV